MIQLISYILNFMKRGIKKTIDFFQTSFTEIKMCILIEKNGKMTDKGGPLLEFPNSFLSLYARKTLFLSFMPAGQLKRSHEGTNPFPT